MYVFFLRGWPTSHRVYVHALQVYSPQSRLTNRSRHFHHGSPNGQSHTSEAENSSDLNADNISDSVPIIQGGLLTQDLTTSDPDSKDTSKSLESVSPGRKNKKKEKKNEGVGVDDAEADRTLIGEDESQSQTKSSAQNDSKEDATPAKIFQKSQRKGKNTANSSEDEVVNLDTDNPGVQIEKLNAVKAQNDGGRSKNKNPGKFKAPKSSSLSSQKLASDDELPAGKSAKHRASKRTIARSNGGTSVNTSVVSPLTTVTGDLVAKLKELATLRGGRMTKLVLIDLLKKGALNKKGQDIVMGQLKANLIFQHPPERIESVIEESRDKGPILAMQEPLDKTGIPLEEVLHGQAGTQLGKHESKKGPATAEPNATKAKELMDIRPLKRKHEVAGYEIKSIDAADLQLRPLDYPHCPVPKLSYGLERVLFNPGVYQLQDPRSRVFNFDPYLQSIMPVHEFDFGALKEYVTSSQDHTLAAIALAERKKYSGSTSSMTSALCHFHYLLSQWRPINPAMLSRRFPSTLETFTALQRSPTAVFLRWKNGTYAIDADKEFDSANILMMLGRSMEKLLTLPTEEYERYRKSTPEQLSGDERGQGESYHYTTMGDFILRSQLDAHDPRLPGTGMFDLKTRAVVSIRMDAKNYEQGLGYEIKGRHGEWESYEREYYDMIRAAFLKYSLQVRMGRMDGIFVAFHNIERIFGFQYVSLPELDLALHGTEDTTIGDSEFKLSLELLNRVLDRATARFPEQSLRLHFETRTGVTPFMYIFAEPVTEDEIREIQESNKASVEEFERRILGLETGGRAEDAEEEQRETEWEALQAKVEKSIKDDETGVDMNIDHQTDRTHVDEGKGTTDTDEILAAISSEMNDDLELRETFDEALEAINRVEGDADEKERGEETEEEEAKEEFNEYDREQAAVTRSNPRSMLEEHVDELPNGIEASPDERSPGYTNNSADNSDNTGSGVSSDIEPDSSEGYLEESHLSSDKDGNGASTSASAGNHVPAEGGRVQPAEADTANKSLSENDRLLAMTLTIRNRVNGEYVLRPEDLGRNDRWNVEYSLAEIAKHETAQNLYAAVRKRRAKALQEKDDEDGRSAFLGTYVQSLVRMSEEGREWRKLQDHEREEEEIKVLGR